MRFLSAFPLLVTCTAAALAVAAQSGGQRGSQSNRILPRAASGERAVTVITSLSVTPGSITFSASDPDSGAISGSSAATVSWSLIGVPLGGGNWRIDVQAPSSTFPNCSRVPVAAVRATCTAVNISGLGVGGAGACASPANLSTTALTLASGTERVGISTTTVSVSYTFTDSWRYTAPETPACSMSLTYTLVAD